MIDIALHAVLGRSQSEAAAVQSFLEQACQSSAATVTSHSDNNKGHQLNTGPLIMSSSQMQQKGGANNQNRDDQNRDDKNDNNNYNDECSALLPTFWAEFFCGLSFSCAPAVCLGFDDNGRLRMAPLGTAATLSPTPTTTARDNLPSGSLEGFAVCFADASEFNQKLRAWQAFVSSNYSQSCSQSPVARGGTGVTEGSVSGIGSGGGSGSGAVVPPSGVQWGTAAALSLPIPNSNPHNKPHALRQQQQHHHQQSAVDDLNPADSLPPPPPTINANAHAAPTALLSSSHPLPLAVTGEDTLYQVVVFHVTCNSHN